MDSLTAYHAMHRSPLSEELIKSEHLPLSGRMETVSSSNMFSSAQQQSTNANGSKGRMIDNDSDVPMTFPQKLMEVLGTEAIGDVIAWLHHGKGFLIYKKKKFATEVLPKFFKQSKFTSFTRKLNRWGFVRITRGPETGAYYHKLFQRGDLRLCMQMSCYTTKQPSHSVPHVNINKPSKNNPHVAEYSQDPSTAVLAEQNVSIIRQQIQQLQLQQLQLQQLQFQQQQEEQQQQQQQRHDNEMMRVYFSDKDCKDSLVDDSSQFSPFPNAQYLHMYQQLHNLEQQIQQQQQQQQQQQEVPKEDVMLALKSDSQFMQTSKDSDIGLMNGGGPIALWPPFGAQAFMGGQIPMEQDGFRPSAAGNGRAWAA